MPQPALRLQIRPRIVRGRVFGCHRRLMRVRIGAGRGARWRRIELHACGSTHGIRQGSRCACHGAWARAVHRDEETSPRARAADAGLTWTARREHAPPSSAMAATADHHAVSTAPRRRERVKRAFRGRHVSARLPRTHPRTGSLRGGRTIEKSEPDRVSRGKHQVATTRDTSRGHCA